MSGQSDNDGSGKNRYGISGIVQDVSLSGGKEPVLKKLRHACEKKTTHEGDDDCMLAEEAFFTGVPAYQPCYERVREEHYEVGITVKSDAHKIAAQIDSGGAEFVEAEKHHHCYIDDEQDVD